MDKRLKVILCAYCHLPSGTDEAGFDRLYKKEIKPLISALDKYPGINMVLDYSGVLLYWIERRKPELFMLLGELLSRKQVELLGGGFYDPMFSLLPLVDKIGQIEMLTTYLRKHFGKKPQGCWIPSMTWEQNLVGPLNSSGMSYIFLDDRQFLNAGIEPCSNGYFHPCITEDQGKLITVFPVSETMGKEISGEGNPGMTFQRLLEMHSERIVVIPVKMSGDNESSFFYDDLFDKLSSMVPLADFCTPSKIIKSLKGLKRVYFPGTQPKDPENQQEHGGESRINPRNFIAHYPEAGNIYAKTVYIHTLINNRLRGDKARKRAAFEELYKAQDSGIYRVGSAGSPGLFHSPVRKAAYSSLIESEKIIREKGKFKPSLSVFDYDLDGEGEYIFQDDKINCYIKSRGADIFELDYLPAAWNYLDTMSVNRGTGQRSAFTDWLAPPGTGPEQTAPEGIWQGRYCGTEEYEAADIDRIRRRAKFKLPANEGLPWGEIEIEKTWQLKKSSITLDYLLKNTGNHGISFVFSTQIDLSFPGIGERFLRSFIVREEDRENIIKECLIFNDTCTMNDVKILEFQDIENETLIILESSRNFNSRIFHINSDLGGYQSTCLLPLYPLTLEAGKTWKLSFSLKINS